MKTNLKATAPTTTRSATPARHVRDGLAPPAAQPQPEAVALIGGKLVRVKDGRFADRRRPSRRHVRKAVEIMEARRVIFRYSDGVVIFERRRLVVQLFKAWQLLGGMPAAFSYVTGINLATIYSWKKRAEKDGVDSLNPNVRIPLSDKDLAILKGRIR